MPLMILQIFLIINQKCIIYIMLCPDILIYVYIYISKILVSSRFNLRSQRTCLSNWCNDVGCVVVSASSHWLEGLYKNAGGSLVEIWLQR